MYQNLAGHKYTQMITITIPITAFSQNCRVLIDSQSLKATVIDPGGDVDLIYSAINSVFLKEMIGGAVELESVFITHSHLDHVGGLSRFLAGTETKPKVYAHSIEKEFRENIEAHSAFFGIPRGEFLNAPEPDIYLDNLGEFKLGTKVARTLFTPGHSPGHVCLYFVVPDLKVFSFVQGDFNLVYERENLGKDVKFIIAGDTLFNGSIGRTDLPGGNHEQLISSIKREIFTLPDDTIVMPGHGPDTSVIVEKETNPFF